MLDLAAGAAAARRVLEEAPTFDGGAGTPVVHFPQLVQAILAAANPDALIIPAYDQQLAESARYRLEPDTENGQQGARMSVTAHPGTVAIGVYAERPNLDQARDGIEQARPRVLTSGLISPDGVWHLGLALCSAAVEARRLLRDAAAERPAEVEG